MNLWRAITEKSWEHVGETDGPTEAAAADQPKRVALRVFLCVVASVFFLLFVAYRIRMDYPDWRPLPLPSILWINTALLVLASVAMQWTRVKANAEQDGPVRLGMILSGLLTLAFIGGQLLAWHQLQNEGYGVRANPAGAFFFLLTAVHGLHILGGLWVWFRATARSFGKEGAVAVRSSVGLCATYWHFLLLVWLVMLYFLLTN